MDNTYNWRTNYATRSVSLRCNSKSDVEYLRDWIDEMIDNNRDVFGACDWLLWDLLDTHINRDELLNSFDDDDIDE